MEALLLSARDASELLGISRSLFYVLGSDGRLGPRSVAFGRRKLWRREELEAWVEAECPPRLKWGRHA